MVDQATQLPLTAKDAKVPGAPSQAWQPLDDLRREIDRLFERFDRADWLRPLRSLDMEPVKSALGLATPVVDIVEKDDMFELTAELAGMEPRDIDVSTRNGNIVIKGERRDEREESGRGYRLHERRYGSFERSFPLPSGVDTSAIEARFDKGLLTVTLPKTLEARAPGKKIEVRAA